MYIVNLHNVIVEYLGWIFQTFFVTFIHDAYSCRIYQHPSVLHFNLVYLLWIFVQLGKMPNKELLHPHLMTQMRGWWHTCHQTMSSTKLLLVNQLAVLQICRHQTLTNLMSKYKCPQHIEDPSGISPEEPDTTSMAPPPTKKHSQGRPKWRARPPVWDFTHPHSILQKNVRRDRVDEECEWKGIYYRRWCPLNPIQTTHPSVRDIGDATEIPNEQEIPQWCILCPLNLFLKNDYLGLIHYHSVHQKGLLVVGDKKCGCASVGRYAHMVQTTVLGTSTFIVHYVSTPSTLETCYQHTTWPSIGRQLSCHKYAIFWSQQIHTEGNINDIQSILMDVWKTLDSCYAQAAYMHNIGNTHTEYLFLTWQHQTMMHGSSNISAEHLCLLNILGEYLCCDFRDMRTFMNIHDNYLSRIFVIIDGIFWMCLLNTNHHVFLFEYFFWTFLFLEYSR